MCNVNTTKSFCYLFFIDVAAAPEFALKCHLAAHDETTVSEVAEVVVEVVAAAAVVAPEVDAIVTGMLHFVSVQSILSGEFIQLF